jgi:hypothetical protein
MWLVKEAKRNVQRIVMLEYQKKISFLHGTQKSSFLLNLVSGHSISENTGGFPSKYFYVMKRVFKQWVRMHQGLNWIFVWQGNKLDASWEQREGKENNLLDVCINRIEQVR